MPSEAQTAAQNSLSILEERFLEFCDEERYEIDALRAAMRKFVSNYGASAELAILAVGFEIAIKEKQ